MKKDKVFTAAKERIFSVLAKMAKTVNPAIEELLCLNVDKKYQDAIKYPVLTGGKRLRPSLAIISCLSLSGKVKDVLYPAAALEILHNYSLILDDIIDGSVLRRNKPTAWIKLGASITECVGIGYFASVFQGANKSNNPVRISEVFAETTKTLAGGEILDILFEHGGREKEPYVIKHRYKNISINDYIEMISRKTASLFQASCEIGGICARVNERQVKALKNYGFNLGMAFQISDDILDILGDGKKFGKKIGQDIEKMKGGNIVICLALQEFTPSQKKEFWSILRKGKIGQKDILRITQLIKNTKAKQKSLVYCGAFIKRAEESLKNLPHNQWKDVLELFPKFILAREK